MKKNLITAPLLFFLAGLSLAGQDINTLISREVNASLTFAESMYRDLHQNPELSFQEFRTASKMAEELRKLGFDVTTGIGRQWCRRSHEERERTSNYAAY